MTDRNGQTSEQPSPAQPPSVVTFYWLITLQHDNGLQLTCDGTMPAVPGTHTRMTTSRAIMDDLRERHGTFTVLFLYLEPNEISAPAGAA
ncbi:hypothetical protein ACFU96_27225 [Streptomyces sp. NPDC057620]|uniref:hypothetical protein n=1 Tax=Streptomyces sp. NPDC057620 TaxID=3346185 RepID=UPI00369CF065